MNDRVKTKTVNLGRLPVYCGLYKETTTYHKYNIVTYYGSTFINLVEGNKKCPVNIVTDSSSRLISYDFNINGSWSGWNFVANSFDASIYATNAGDYAKFYGDEAKRIVEQGTNATYRGNKNLVLDLELPIESTNNDIAEALNIKISEADNNDYCYVSVPESIENPTTIVKVKKFKYNGNSWAYEYDVNDSIFTKAQWDAINSGITSEKLSEIETDINNTVKKVEIPKEPGASVNLPDGGYVFTWNGGVTEYKAMYWDDESESEMIVFVARQYPSEYDNSRLGKIWNAIVCDYDYNSNIISYYDTYTDPNIPDNILALFNEKEATTNRSGLMSASDKVKLDKSVVYQSLDEYIDSKDRIPFIAGSTIYTIDNKEVSSRIWDGDCSFDILTDELKDRGAILLFPKEILPIIIDNISTFNVDVISNGTQICPCVAGDEYVYFSTTSSSGDDAIINLDAGEYEVPFTTPQIECYNTFLEDYDSCKYLGFYCLDGSVGVSDTTLLHLGSFVEFGSPDGSYPSTVYRFSLIDESIGYINNVSWDNLLQKERDLWITEIEVATPEKKGLMSAEDKVTLDFINSLIPSQADSSNKLVDRESFDSSVNEIYDVITSNELVIAEAFNDINDVIPSQADSSNKLVDKASFDSSINDINSLIPSQASPSNKLVDKASFDSSINDINSLIPSQADSSNKLVDKASFDSSINDIYDVISSNELVTAEALVNLKNTKADSSSLATVATTGSYNDLIDKPTIPTVPTNVSFFINDAGYLTQHQDITGKEDSSNKITTLDASCTDTQYLSAKAIYDVITSNELVTAEALVNLKNTKVDKVEGKGLSTNDFTVVELTNYLTESAALPTDDNLIYVYYGKVVEKRMCEIDADNDAILFIVERTVSDGEMDNLTVLAYVRSGGGDYAYEYEATYHTTYSNCPTWVKAACGVVYVDNYNVGLATPDLLDEIADCQKKQTVQNINNSSSSTISADVSVGYDYSCTNAVNTFQFNLSGSDGYIGLLFTTGTTPNITFDASSNIYAQDGLSFETNSRYEVNVKSIEGYYYVTAVKMVQIN